MVQNRTRFLTVAVLLVLLVTAFVIPGISSKKVCADETFETPPSNTHYPGKSGMVLQETADLLCFSDAVRNGKSGENFVYKDQGTVIYTRKVLLREEGLAFQANILVSRHEFRYSEVGIYTVNNSFLI